MTPAPNFLGHKLPSMAVACPDCRARAGTWCKRPSGHKAMGMHKRRHEEADRVWLLHDLPTITHRRDGTYVYDGPETRPSITSKEAPMAKIGPKEQQRIDMRIRNAKAANRPSTISASAPAQAEPQEDTMTKNRKTKTATKGRRKATSAPKNKTGAKSRKKAASPRKAAGAKASGKETKTDQLKAFLQEPGGKVSADIETKFGWLPHTTRAAISRIEGVVKIKDETRGATVYSIAA